MIQIYNWIADSSLFLFATNALLQITLLMALALTAGWFYRRDAAVRYYILLSALCGVLLIPVLTATFQRCEFSFVGLQISWSPIESTEVPETMDRDLSLGNIVTTAEEYQTSQSDAGSKSGGSNSALVSGNSDQSSFLMTTLPGLIRAVRATVMLVWIFGCLLGVLGVVRGFWKLRKIIRRARPVTLEYPTEQVCQILGIDSLPRIASSTSISGPMVAGIIQPVILLPTKLINALSENELRDVLLHETAHVLRRDQIITLLQRMMGVLFWLHPMIRILNHQLARAREEICDNYVLSAVGPVDYGQTLFHVCELMPQQRVLAGSIGMLNVNWKLEDRISDLLDTRRNSTVNIRFAVAGVIAFCAVCLVIFVSGSQLMGAVAQDAQQISIAEPQLQRIQAVKEPLAITDNSVDRLVEFLKQKSVRGKEEVDQLNLFAMNVSDGSVTLVAQEPRHGLVYCGTPEWSNEGQKIIFDASPGRNWKQTRLLAIDSNAGGAEVVDLGPGNCPTFSPDGKQIAFLLNSGVVPGAKSGIWLMDSDGSNRRLLGGYGIPVWSPDGSKLLVESFSSPRNLSVMDVETGEENPIKLEGYKIYSKVSWADDGNTLVSVVVSNQGTGIALIDVTEPSEAKIKQVLWRRGDQFDVAPGCPVYSSKTRRCVFTGRTETGTALYVLNVDRLDPPQRLEPEVEDNKLLSLALSPDGRYVLFCSDRPGFELPAATSIKQQRSE